MRLRRLDLTAYGKFTGRSLDFGPRTEGEPDLHIVYGPNEAGKSTAFSAFLDLLFGIELQSRYGFLHSYDAMRVGGCVELSVGARELVRIKKPQPTLRDAAGAPVGESLILGDLAGLDRTAYRTMFSLDDESLEAGGKSILASNGELGRLLFSASAGLSELSRTLAELRTRTEGFAKPARSSELHHLKASLAALKQERDAIDVIASDYNRLKTAQTAAEAAYAASLEELAQVQTELEGLRRVLRALPRAAVLHRLQGELESLAGLPAAPPGWLAELPALQLDEQRFRTRMTLAQAELQRLDSELAEIQVDASALGLVGRLDRLTQLRARYVTAALDLPQRRGELARCHGELDALLMRLSRPADPAPERLSMDAVRTAALQTLIAVRSGIEARLTAATEELSLALHDLTEAQQALHAANLPEAGLPTAAVAPVLAAWRDSDHAPRHRTASRAEAQHGEALASQLRALAPWRGDAAALDALKLPDATRVEAWLKAEQKDEAALPQLAEAAERREAELERRTAEHDAIVGARPGAGEQDAPALRALREAAWARHRGLLDADSADAFEAALRQDDFAAEARATNDRDAARLHELGQVLAMARTEAALARKRLGDAVTGAATRAAEIAQATAAIGSEISPAWLIAWMARRERALASWTSLGEATRDRAAAEADAAALHRRMSAALVRAGVAIGADATLDELAEAAQRCVDRQAEAQALRRALEDCRRNVAKRERAVQGASLEDKTWLKAWHGAWSAAGAETWLGKDGNPPQIEAAREILAGLADLRRVLAARGDLAGRIEAMAGDQAAFVAELARLAPEADPAIAPADQALALAARVQEAQRAEQTRLRLQEAREAAAETLRQIRADAAAHAARVADMAAAMQADSLHDLAGKLVEAERRAQLLRQAEETTQDIMATLRAADLGEAQAMLDGQEAPALDLTEAKLAARLADLEQRTRELFATARQAEAAIAAVGGDDAAARIEERRRTRLLETEEKAGRYLRLRAGIAAAEWGLRAYRDHHRSSMMTQASDAFQLISRGAYLGLRAQPDREGDILVAIAANGASKLATDLSKGTRFQLYLALRAAGYREFAKLRPPVPFIADDIMETFDDLRTAETLRLFEGMSQLGQVIYLTHHDHVRELAERTVPAVRVHSLTA